MEDLSLHILDIAENSVAAGAENISISIREDVRADLLIIEIADDGKGMSEEHVERASDPFFTSRTTRKVGLGLALLKEAAEAANGRLEIESAAGKGTLVRATLQRSHIDRKPLGNMPETIVALLATGSDINITYRHECEGEVVELDTRELKERLEGVPLNTVRTMNVLRDYLTHEEDHLAHHG